MTTFHNVNVFQHAGEILALAEGGAPVAITADLETLGAASRHPGLAGGMTAHPKVDPETGELMTFRTDWNKPWLRNGVADRKGAQSVDIEIELPSPSMMHDMAITAAHSILLDLNVAYDFSMLSRGHRMPLRWQDARKARIGIIPRRGGQMRWFEVTPCFIQHMVNAYDADASTIVLDAVRYPHFLRLADNGAAFEDNLEPRNRSIDCRFTLRRPKMAALEKSKVSRRHRPSARSTATNAPATSPEKIKSP